MWYVVSYECFYPVRSRLTSFYGGGGGGGGGGGQRTGRMSLTYSRPWNIPLQTDMLKVV